METMKNLSNFIQEKLHISQYKKGEKFKNNIHIIKNFLYPIAGIVGDDYLDIETYCNKYGIDRVIICADEVSINSFAWKQGLDKKEIWEIDKLINYDSELFDKCLQFGTKLLGPNRKKYNVVDMKLSEGDEYLVGNKENLLEYVYEPEDITIFFVKADENNKPLL